MVGTPRGTGPDSGPGGPAVTAVPAVPAVPGSLVPGPRRPAEAAGPGARVRWYYESVLGWPTAPGTPVRLRTGVRFDVLDVPVQAGHAALRRLGPPGATPRRPGFPVALRAGGCSCSWPRAARGAARAAGVLEWGSLPLDLTAVGAGGLVEAPLLPATGAAGAAGSAGATDATGSADVAGSAGAAGSADVGRAGRGSALPPPRPRDHDGRARRVPPCGCAPGAGGRGRDLAAGAVGRGGHRGRPRPRPAGAHPRYGVPPVPALVPVRKPAARPGDAMRAYGAEPVTGGAAG